jgi:hypothetical protein
MCMNMTAAEELKLAKQYEELWNGLLPGVETPGSGKFQVRRIPKLTR